MQNLTIFLDFEFKSFLSKHCVLDYQWYFSKSKANTIYRTFIAYTEGELIEVANVKMYILCSYIAWFS